MQSLEGERISVKEVVQEVKAVKKSRKKRNIILGACFSLFIVYAVITLISQQMQINKKQSELSDLEDRIIIQEIKNDKVKDVYDSGDDKNEAYVKKIAREELDYAEPDERVFINIAGE